MNWRILVMCGRVDEAVEGPCLEALRSWEKHQTKVETNLKMIAFLRGNRSRKLKPSEEMYPMI